MPYITGYNLRSYSPDPDHIHVHADLDDARERIADELKRWADDCYSVPTDLPDEQEDLESIAAELSADAETVREWIITEGGRTVTRGPDGNEYVFWVVPKSVDQLRADGWPDAELIDAGIIDH